MAEKLRRGFAAMPVETQRRIASSGGVAAHQKGTCHEWTSEEAAAAGRLGGCKRVENLAAKQRGE